MQALHDWLSHYGRRLAVDAANEQLSYEELSDRARAMALELLERGVSPGDRVGVQLESGVPLIVALHAIWMFRGIAAPLSTRLTADELGEALRTLAPKALITPAGIRDEPSGPGDAPHHDASRDFAILWTSGTSGTPRGVLLTKANIGASARAAQERMSLGPDDRWYLGLSSAHVGGLALVTRAALLGAAVVVRGSFAAATFNELVDEGRVTHASLVPTMLLQALDARRDRPPPASLRGVLIGGAHAPRDLVERALGAGFPVWLTYGMTEATSQVATAAPELVRAKPGTVGAPVAGVEVRIAKIETGAEKLEEEPAEVGSAGRAATGEKGSAHRGEILVRGPTVAAAYLYGDREAAGPAHAGGAKPLADPDGWFHTGDLGFLDPEGHLFVTGRLSDRIISAGVNVEPAEVEEVLRRHPLVIDAAVVGLSDPVWGEVVGALVVATHDAALAGDCVEVLRDDLDRYARAHLASSKVPRRYAFADELPRNANGKVDRARVREALSGE